MHSSHSNGTNRLSPGLALPKSVGFLCFSLHGLFQSTELPFLLPWFFFQGRWLPSSSCGTSRLDPKYNNLDTSSSDIYVICFGMNHSSDRIWLEAIGFVLNIVRTFLPIWNILGVPLSSNGLQCRIGKTKPSTSGSNMVSGQPGEPTSISTTRSETL